MPWVIMKAANEISAILTSLETLELDFKWRRKGNLSRNLWEK